MWKGVYISSVSKRVNKIILPRNGLTGPLPQSLYTTLTALVELDLRDNEITGTRIYLKI